MRPLNIFAPILGSTLITSVTDYIPNKEAIASAVERGEELFAYFNEQYAGTVAVTTRNNSDNRTCYSLGNLYIITAGDVRTKPLAVIFASDEGVLAIRYQETP